MQVYEKRDDNKVLLDLLQEVFAQLKSEFSLIPGYASILNALEKLSANPDLTDATVRQFLPDVRRALGALQKTQRLYSFSLTTFISCI